MVRSTIIVSALFALVASVTAVPRPHGSVVGIDADYIGTGDINLQGAGNHVANANNVCVHDIGQDIKVGKSISLSFIRVLFN
jgi:hypothetical protein